MKKQIFHLPENMNAQVRNTFWSIIVLLAGSTINSIVAFKQATANSTWQAWTEFGVVAMFFVALLASAYLERRGRAYQAIGLSIGAFLFTIIVRNALTEGLGVVYGLIVIGITSAIAFLNLPQKTANRVTIASIVIGGLIVMFDRVVPPYRQPTPPALLNSLPYVAAFVIAFLLFVLLRQLWTNGRIQNRIIVVLSAILIPILVAFTWYNIQSQKQDLEKELTDKAETVAISGAATIGHMFEEAIANGDLTTEQVFDTNYVLYWEFKPATYEFDGNPPTLNKFHTAYDTYTDEKWQKLLDSYLNQEDFVFTIPVDKNGYLPTHNTRWSSWDGSPATDRSKRIFNDPVGINAARNTQPTLVQVYPRPGTGETLLDVSAPIYVNGEHWGAFRVGTLLVENNLLAQSSIQSATRRGLLVSSLLVIGVVASSWFIGRYISKSLEKLTESASQLASGQFVEIVDIPDIAEVTTLANAFNSMTSRLQETLQGLEQRVAERTRNLELAADVGRSVSQVRNLDVMLKDAMRTDS